MDSSGAVGVELIRRWNASSTRNFCTGKRSCASTAQELSRNHVQIRRWRVPSKRRGKDRSLKLQQTTTRDHNTHMGFLVSNKEVRPHPPTSKKVKSKEDAHKSKSSCLKCMAGEGGILWHLTSRTFIQLVLALFLLGLACLLLGCMRLPLSFCCSSNGDTYARIQYMK